MKFESTLLNDPIRRVVIELPQSRACALAYALTTHVTWANTAVEDELAALYDALEGDDG